MTNRTVFDLIDEPQKEKDPATDYFEFAESRSDDSPQNHQPKDPQDEFWESLKDWGKDAVKSLAIGVNRLGRMMGPTYGPETVGKSEADLEAQLEMGLQDYLPTEEGGFVRQAMNRGLKNAPSILGLPGGATAAMGRRQVAGAFLGQGAEDLGFGPIGQTIAELTAYIGPSLAKKLLAEGKDAELIKLARQKGMTDEQIALLLQPEVKQKWLSKISSRGKTTQKRLANTKAGVSKLYDDIRTHPEASEALTEATASSITNEIETLFDEMPAEVREALKPDYEVLLKVGLSPKSLTTFWRKINYYTTNHPEMKELARLKSPIRKGIASVSKELASDFDFANKLYSRYATISKNLRPTLVSKLISGTQALRLAGGILTGYYPLIIETLGEQGAKLIGREMLTNPRFYNLTRKMGQALNAGKYQIAQKIGQQIAQEIEPIDKDAAEQFRKLDYSDLQNMASD